MIEFHFFVKNNYKMFVRICWVNRQMSGRKKMIKFYKLIIASGIITFLSLSITLIIGILRLNFRIHHLMGIATIVFASIHAGLILYRQLKLKGARSDKMHY